MPELPEVETTCRGIRPHVVGERVTRVEVREPRLRWPVPADLPEQLAGQRLQAVDRRAKYLLLRTDAGTALLHLGMSGSLRVLKTEQPAARHDHVDIWFESRTVLRLNDPRRFGALLWAPGNPLEHPLLSHLGPEPLGEDFSGDYLYQVSRGRRGPVKNFIMDGRIVVGVGNIYASEALFRAGIHPLRAAGRVGRARYQQLETAIRQVLAAAIDAGGTTLRDFVDGDGQPGYFSQSLAVYGRAGEACQRCGDAVRSRVIGQRASYYCASCQR